MNNIIKRKKISVAITLTLLLAVVNIGTSVGIYAKQVDDSKPTTYRIMKSKYKDIKIPKHTKQQFEKKFGKNPKIPRTNEDVLALAKKLYSKENNDAINKEYETYEECGESEHSALYCALSNPEISDSIIEIVGALAEDDRPNLPLTYTDGHFVFHYTTNDETANNNVTRESIEATATVLNNAWNDFETNFVKPKSIDDTIDVYVYDIVTNNWLGFTSSGSNDIDLDSVAVVSNQNKRQSTPVHELFHRVQYSYDYKGGVDKWAAEGTAAWSQKYRASNIGDWIGRMNESLNAPDKDLMAERQYDACSFWVYAAGLSNDNNSFGRNAVEREFIKNTWQEYKNNGNDMKKAVETAIQSKSKGLSFNTVASWWMETNFCKDLQGTMAHWDYEEDEWRKPLGGPLNEVRRTTENLSIDSPFSITDSVKPYGADYYLFNIDQNAGCVEFSSDWDPASMGYAIIKIKDGTYVGATTCESTDTKLNHIEEFTPGSIDQICVIVKGMPSNDSFKGGYTLKASAKNVLANYSMNYSSTDSTGLNSDINLTNAPYQADGSVYSNGIWENGIIQTPIIENFDFNDFCITADFKIDAFPQELMPIIVGGNSYRWIGANVETDGTISLLWNNSNFTVSNKKVPLDQYNRVTIRYSNGLAKLYLNGELACQQNYIIDHNYDSNILNSNNARGITFLGYLKNLTIY